MSRSIFRRIGSDRVSKYFISLTPIFSKRVNKDVIFDYGVSSLASQYKEQNTLEYTSFFNAVTFFFSSRSKYDVFCRMLARTASWCIDVSFLKWSMTVCVRHHTFAIAFHVFLPLFCLIS